MYNPKYQYNAKFFPGLTNFLNDLYERSVYEYQFNPHLTETEVEEEHNLQQIHKFIECLEDYIVALTKIGFLNTNNISDVLKEIKKIKSISILPKDKRNVFGITYFDYRIEMNPNIKSSNNLTSDQRTLLYVGHQVGHIIHKMWSKDIDEYLKLTSSNASLKDLIATTSQKNRLCIYEGFSLIDEATAQELAEQVVYYLSNQERPQQQLYVSPKIYNGEPFKSNFDYFTEIEEPAILFGQTLKSITKNSSSNSEIISELAKKSLNKNFINEIISEYNATSTLQQDLFNTLICLGRIKDASYAMHGKANFSDSQELSKKYFDNLKYLCKKKENYNPKVIKKI